MLRHDMSAPKKAEAILAVTMSHDSTQRHDLPPSQKGGSSGAACSAILEPFGEDRRRITVSGSGMFQLPWLLMA